MQRVGDPTPRVTPTIANTLAQLQSRGLSRLDAQLLLLLALGREQTERAWLVAHDTDWVPTQVLEALHALAIRRLAGEPLAYLTGHKEFFGLDLVVDRRVLVPRPETETLVEWTLELLAQTAKATVLDLGTGSGAIALALKHARPSWELHALDASADALTVARNNARRHGLEVNFRQGDWCTGLVGQFDAIVSNPPYIAAHDEHLAALSHEPLQALASGTDGLDDIRNIIDQSRSHLIPGGWLLLEHGYDQAAAVRALLSAGGFTEAQSRRDLAGIERCSGARQTLRSVHHSSF